MGNKMKIGVIGQGFVGSAIREGLKGFYEIYTYDLNPELRNCETLVDVVKNAEVIFVCLPTPMTNDGSCHIGIVKGVISDIDEICKTNNYKNRIAIIKSTVPPGTTDKLNAAAKNIAVAFSPEFLTEANSFEDFKNQTRIIIGANRPASTRIKSMFRKAFPAIPIIKTSSQHAEIDGCTR
jgi:UDPglucose 6-dehydrogenase